MRVYYQIFLRMTCRLSTGIVWYWQNAKFIKDAVKNQKKKWRAGVVFPYCPGIDPIHGILPGRDSALAYEFLEELKAFFGS
jgi:hypothetical protein